MSRRYNPLVSFSFACTCALAIATTAHAQLEMTGSWENPKSGQHFNCRGWMDGESVSVKVPEFGVMGVTQVDDTLHMTLRSQSSPAVREFIGELRVFDERPTTGTFTFVECGLDDKLTQLQSRFGTGSIKVKTTDPLKDKVKITLTSLDKSEGSEAHLLKCRGKMTRVSVADPGHSSCN